MLWFLKIFAMDNVPAVQIQLLFWVVDVIALFILVVLSDEVERIWQNTSRFGGS